ncbi:hypothetical protein Moror_2499 [Moniliophthora roreri MCA 2997]|uniref:Uncharacterized protein n=1 Tax=Moniliophthora roreri (strain MCA 2997) TaxID=1381753 RepID=V2XFG9_MONRO|nr:hypothetical protein Moror_2499 [Moniliophthora roreri MCA 2997]
MKSTLLLISFISLSTNAVIASTNFSLCLAEIIQNNNNTSSPWFNKLLDHNGVPVPLNDTSRGKSISYKTCVDACGHGQERFQWSTFSQEFSAWLLPYLALLSQLPFGAQDKLENLSSVLLTLGSPTLAAYSIAITILNGRWIARLFSSHSYPNTRNAIRILSSLQQAPLQISLDPYLLSSLIILPENDEWWAELVVWIDYTHTWSISAATSVAWVLIAYVFTVIDSFTDITGSYNVSGQGVGSAWLWLLPVVIAWLQISPKCDSLRVYQAVRRANEIAFVATQDGGVRLAADVNAQRAIYLQKKRNPLYSDQYITAPVFNYSRVFSWTITVEIISEYFREATRRADLFEPVSSRQRWLPGNRNVRIRPENRSGTSREVEDYCKPDLNPSPKSFGSGIWMRVVLASILAVSLQWGTAGAAILVVIRTPTTGLGCRSGAYILYAGISTVVWAMLVLSSILAHYVSTLQVDFPHRRWKTTNYRAKLATWISVLLRKLAKVLATANAVWIVITCLFQFSAFFDRCYCNSSVLGRGAERAFDVMDPSDDVASMQAAWIGGVVLASGTAFLFLLFVNTMIDPALPDE